MDRPGDLATVLRVLYLVFNEGYTGDVDLASEAIRLTRQLASTADDPEVAGLLSLCCSTTPDGQLVLGLTGVWCPWRSRTGRDGTPPWSQRGVEILQTALARDRLGEYQAQAAIAALHADAGDPADTDWVQIVGWHDELVHLIDSPVVRLNRAVAVAEAAGAEAGLVELSTLDRRLPRYEAVEAYLTEKAGDLTAAAALYAAAARVAQSLPERDHQTWQAARIKLFTPEQSG